MATAKDILELARKLHFDASIWAKYGKVRIYADAHRKDAKVFLECDMDGDEVTGARLQVVLITNGVSYQWMASQQRMLKDRFVGLFHAYVVECYKESDLNSCGSTDIQEMIIEAREFVAARLKEEESEDDGQD